MLAVVITPSNSVLYVGNTNGLRSATQTIVNGYEPWGGGLVIGGDPGNSATGRSFGGAISSVAMFSNSLSYAQIATLFDAGLANDNQLPFIIQNPLSSKLLTNFVVNATFSAAGYGVTLPNGSYWQRSTTPGVWVTLFDAASGGPANIFGSHVTNTGVVSFSSTLTVSNVSAADVGSYQLVIANSLGNSVTSTVATLLLVSAPPANSFASAVLTPGYGAVAYWPLNETNDPSSGTAEAYDVIGGFNGLYGVNAANGGGNTADGFAPVQGPAAAGLTGFSSGGALGSLHNVLPSTYVSTLSGPTFPVNQTNQTIVAWICPNTPQTSHQGVWTIRAAGETNGLSTGVTSGQLNYNWDNNAAATTGFASGLGIPINTWSMAALVITPTNSTLYLGSTNGLQSSTQVITNINEPGGLPIYLGTDPNSLPSDSFGGAISSVAMFSNSLSYAQIATLYDAGLANDNQLPFITQNPLSSKLLTNFVVNATFTAAGCGGTLINGSYWQKSTASGVWVTLFDAASGGPANISGSQITNSSLVSIFSTLTVSNVSSADLGSYQLVITNSLGNSVTSAVATLSLVSAPPASSFASAVLTPGYGAVAYWPLNETNDPSSGTAEAYDIVGGFNGVYGLSAQDGGNNAGLPGSLAAAGLEARNDISPVSGPGAAGFRGLPPPPSRP